MDARGNLAPPLGRLYPIVDLQPGSHAPLALLDALLDARAPWIQLRCKSSPAGAFAEIARIVVLRAAERGSRVIVNDRADVACVAGAAGVHLGQSDLPLAVARRLLGPAAIVGVSTHDVDEARRAEAQGADYVGFGPIYATGSKPDALSPRGLAALRAVRVATRLPIVAIGGIDETTAADVIAVGADAVAMIGALSASGDPRSLAMRILALRD
jgi:thiamine-phosphate pyrophosphorylase